MNKLCIDLENCYGIGTMKHEIDYLKSNIAIIYAPNGTMKSSLAKTFDAISKNQKVEERVYGYDSKYSIIDERGNAITPNSIIVVNPFDKEDCKEQGLLMANPDLRKQYIEIHKSIDFLKEVLFSKLKKQLGYGPRTKFDAEVQFLFDWGYQKNKMHECLEAVNIMMNDPDMSCDLNVDDVDYELLFNDKVIDMISSGETAKLIVEYERKYSELIEQSLYMHKGIIDHNNYSNISKVLNSNGFFSAKNEIRLNAKDGSESREVKSHTELDQLIQREKERILNTQELKSLFEQINKLIDKNKETRAMNNFIQSHQEIVGEYKDIARFKKKIWIKVIQKYQNEFNVLLDGYIRAKEELEKLRKQAKQEVTEWTKVLELFKERFYVPFEIIADNQEDVILNMDMPSFKYIFTDNVHKKEISKDKLLEVLSTGEERAYYILNMIFRIIVAQQEGKEKLIVLDDISESFDYKNKYAIIEFLLDISQIEDNAGNKIFKMLILTHNFDFYRTASSRLQCATNAFIAYTDDGNIKFSKSMYIRNLFSNYKSKIKANVNDKLIVATIPFVRNLIEYKEGEEDNAYKKLTSLLHYKKDTVSIKLKEIEKIYEDHWLGSGKTEFAKGREEESVYGIIIAEADKINNNESIEIENKLVLSIAIRLKAEKYMIKNIIEKVPNGEEIVNRIREGNRQTGILKQAYKENIVDENINLLEQVTLMTSENIHINSFMYEPILDMSVKHLYDLYHKITILVDKE